MLQMSTHGSHIKGYAEVTTTTIITTTTTAVSTSTTTTTITTTSTATTTSTRTKAHTLAINVLEKIHVSIHLVIDDLQVTDHNLIGKTSNKRRKCNTNTTQRSHTNASQAYRSQNLKQVRT